MSSPPLRGSAEWSARREVVLLLELTGGNRRRAQWLWLQKERTKAEASQLASATSPQARQQPAGCQAKPATARARVVPKPKKSAARLAKDRRRLNQKHLASKMWAYVRVASRMLAWCTRARTRCGHPTLYEHHCTILDDIVRNMASLGPRKALERKKVPWLGALKARPILVGRLLAQQWPSRRAVEAGPTPAPAPLALPAPPPATQLAPSTPRRAAAPPAVPPLACRRVSRRRRDTTAVWAALWVRCKLLNSVLLLSFSHFASRNLGNFSKFHHFLYTFVYIRHPAAQQWQNHSRVVCRWIKVANWNDVRPTGGRQGGYCRVGPGLRCVRGA